MSSQKFYYVSVFSRFLCCVDVQVGVSFCRVNVIVLVPSGEWSLPLVVTQPKVLQDVVGAWPVGKGAAATAQATKSNSTTSNAPADTDAARREAASAGLGIPPLVAVEAVARCLEACWS